MIQKCKKICKNIMHKLEKNNNAKLKSKQCVMDQNIINVNKNFKHIKKYFACNLN